MNLSLKVRHGYIAWRHNKISLFASSSQGDHSRVTRAATQQKVRALVSSHRGKGRKM